MPSSITVSLGIWRLREGFERVLRYIAQALTPWREMWPVNVKNGFSLKCKHFTCVQMTVLMPFPPLYSWEREVIFRVECAESSPLHALDVKMTWGEIDRGIERKKSNSNFSRTSGELFIYVVEENKIGFESLLLKWWREINSVLCHFVKSQI